MSHSAQDLLHGIMPTHQLTGDEIKDCLSTAGALWLYQGLPRPEAPHALLTSGKHSDGFANVGAVLKEYPGFRRIIAGCIYNVVLANRWWLDEPFDFVVGADTSSTDLAHDLAEIANVKHIKMMKIEDKQGKRQEWNPNNPGLFKDTEILQVEELITTISSALAVREGIRNSYPDLRFRFSPYVVTVIDRSDPENSIKAVEYSEILSLLRLEIRNYDPDTCLYCKAGSIAIPPKKDDNWSKLTVKY